MSTPSENRTSNRRCLFRCLYLSLSLFLLVTTNESGYQLYIFFHNFLLLYTYLFEQKLYLFDDFTYTLYRSFHNLYLLLYSNISTSKRYMTPATRSHSSATSIFIAKLGSLNEVFCVSYKQKVAKNVIENDKLFSCSKL